MQPSMSGAQQKTAGLALCAQKQFWCAACIDHKRSLHCCIFLQVLLHGYILLSKGPRAGTWAELIVHCRNERGTAACIFTWNSTRTAACQRWLSTLLKNLSVCNKAAPDIAAAGGSSNGSVTDYAKARRQQRWALCTPLIQHLWAKDFTATGHAGVNPKELLQVA